MSDKRAEARARGVERQKKLRAAFAAFDKDNSGQISVDEYIKIMTRPTKFGAAMTAEEAKEMFAEMDEDNSGEISYEEFVIKWSAETLAILPGVKK